MPLGKAFRKALNGMVKQYGPKKGKSIFYAWVNKHGYDDTKDTLSEESDWELEYVSGKLDVKESGFPFEGNIEQLTLLNNNFRTVIYTDEHMQIALMSIPPHTDIGMEVHLAVEQTLFIVKGIGAANVDNVQWIIAGGDVVVVPSGTYHNFTNIGEDDLKLYTVYVPPEHPAGTVHKTKTDALKDESTVKSNESKVNESTMTEVNVLEKYKLPEDLQMFKFKAFVAYPTISKNNRKYTEEVLRAAAPGWRDKPVILDHDQDNGTLKTVAITQDCYYGTDSLGPTYPERVGLWAKGVGVMRKELFIKMHGIGNMPPLVTGISLGAGGNAVLNPTRIGHDGKPGEDMLSLRPAEFSVTPFPGIEGATIKVEPVEYQEKLKEAYVILEHVTESVLKNEDVKVSEIDKFNKIYSEFGVNVNPTRVDVTISDNLNKLKGEENLSSTPTTVKEDISTQISTMTPTIDATKPVIKEEIAGPQPTKDLGLGKGNADGGSPVAPIQKAPEGPSTGGNLTAAPAPDANVAAPNTSGTVPNEQPPATKDNDAQTHPNLITGANNDPLEEYLEQEIEDLVDEFVPEYTLELVSEAAGKKWIQKAHIKKGALHSQMGVPAGQKIPISKLQAAAKKGGTLGRRARLALTFRGMKKAKESTDDAILTMVKGNASLKEKLAQLLVGEYVHMEPDADDFGGPDDGDKDGKPHEPAKTPSVTPGGEPKEVTSGTAGLAMAQGPPYPKKDKDGKESAETPAPSSAPTDTGASTKTSDSTGPTLTPNANVQPTPPGAQGGPAPNPSPASPSVDVNPIQNAPTTDGGASSNVVSPPVKAPATPEEAVKAAVKEETPKPVLTVSGKQALEPVTAIQEKTQVYTNLREVYEQIVKELGSRELSNKRLMKELAEGKWDSLAP